MNLFDKLLRSRAATIIFCLQQSGRKRQPIRIQVERFILGYLAKYSCVDACDERFHELYFYEFGDKRNLSNWGFKQSQMLNDGLSDFTTWDYSLAALSHWAAIGNQDSHTGCTGTCLVI